MTQSEKQLFIQHWEREFPVTLRVLKSFAADKTGFKPHERSATVAEVARAFPMAQIVVEQTLKGEFTIPPRLPKLPDDFEALVAQFEQRHAGIVEFLQKTPDEEYHKPMTMMMGKDKLGEMPRMQFLWFLLFDGVHHRGQLSVYLRMTGGKVPSIYGPSADEPWM